MKTLTRCCVRACVLAVVIAGLGATSAAAQDVQLTGGSGVYASDAFCLDTNATFSVIELSGGGDLVGASVAYSNGSHPWIDPPDATALSMGRTGAAMLNRGARSSTNRLSSTAQADAFLTNGDAIRIMAEAFPVALLSRIAAQREGTLGDINRYVRPFVGAGVYVSGDGDPAPAGTAGRELPTYGLEGSTSLILSYGARLYLPSRNMPVRLVLLYRGNTMFVGDVVYRTPDNETVRGNGETLTWGEWGVGVSFRIGG